MLKKLYELYTKVGQKMQTCADPAKYDILYWMRGELEEILAPVYVKRNERKYGTKK